MDLKGSQASSTMRGGSGQRGFLFKLIEINCTALRLLDTWELELIAQNESD